MSATASLQRRHRGRAVLSVGACQLARVDNHRVTRRLALSALPRMLERQFVAAHAADLTALYELRVRASQGGPEARFTLEVSRGQLAVRRRSAPEADAWVALGLDDMIRLLSAEKQMMWQLLAAKRLDFGGDPFTAMRFPSLLGL